MVATAALAVVPARAAPPALVVDHPVRGEPLAAVWSADGRWVAVVLPRSVELRTGDRGRFQAEIPVEGVRAAAFDPQDRWLWLAGKGGSSTVWNLADGSVEPLPSPAPTDDASLVAVSPDGTRVLVAGASSSFDRGRWALYDAATHRVVTSEPFAWPDRGGVPLAWSPVADPIAFAASGRDGGLELRDGGDGQIVREWGVDATALAFRPDGGALAVGGRESRIRLLDPTGEVVAQSARVVLLGEDAPGCWTALTWDHAGRRLAGRYGDDRVLPWDTAAAAPPTAPADARFDATSLAWLADGRLAAWGGARSGIWSPDGVAPFPADGWRIPSPDGSMLTATGIRAFDAEPLPSPSPPPGISFTDADGVARELGPWGYLAPDRGPREGLSAHGFIGGNVSVGGVAVGGATEPPYVEEVVDGAVAWRLPVDGLTAAVAGADSALVASIGPGGWTTRVVRLSDGRVTGSLPGRDVRGNAAVFTWNTWVLVGDGRTVWGCDARGGGCEARSVATGERLSALPDGVASGPSADGSRFVLRSRGGACLASAGSSDCKDFPLDVAQAAWRWSDDGRWLWSYVHDSTWVWTPEGDLVATFGANAMELLPGFVKDARPRGFAITRLADRAVVQFEVGGTSWLARTASGVFEAPVLDEIGVRGGSGPRTAVRPLGAEELAWRSDEIVSRFFAGRPLPAAPGAR